MTPDQELERLKQAGPPPERLAEEAAYRAAYRAAHPEADEDPPPPLTEDEKRQQSADRLLSQLDVVTDLTRHCQHMASIPANDRIAPVYAAARLMTATALVAKALGTLTHTETRHRQIIEQAEPLAAQKPYSNAKLDTPAPPEATDLSKQAGAALDSVLFDTLQRKMLLYMNLLAAETFDKDLKKAYPELYETPGEATAQAPAAAPA